jgi:hypothetical protein
MTIQIGVEMIASKQNIATHYAHKTINLHVDAILITKH